MLLWSAASVVSILVLLLVAVLAAWVVFKCPGVRGGNGWVNGNVFPW